ncbi:hypothetical protein RHMOL_Rhmol13G0234400 [Rhododendron molle]|uniref:Uncharacterized protein n=1 Tax=Rhododendron molle TaxID=49168 RepID=A0ACC0LAB5_RHOML|nr:hypothetical protein RHMOL_Rhmol13G0234400 [Rhododendron molle]
MSSSSAQVAHSLAFRVMRLCRPSFHVDTPLRFDPCDLIAGEDLFDDPAEIQTERQRIMLLDTSKSPVESIRAGGRYDFIVEHDVKELGAHTLVCTAMYNDGDSERKYLPQFFKFLVANPLSVRTKVRVVKETTFLEACIENHTKSNLYMDQVDFEPAQHWSATILKADQHHSENSLTREIFKPPVLIKSGGGIHNYLYQLRSSSQGSMPMEVEGSNILGKFQITWRTNLGEPGRLQTQQILGSPITRKEIELQAVEVPSVIILERPFLVRLNLTNKTDRKLGPFEVWISQGDLADEKVVMVNGIQTLALPQVEAYSSTIFQLNLIATRLGVQKITGITVFDTTEKRTYDSLSDLEVGSKSVELVDNGEGGRLRDVWIWWVDISRKFWAFCGWKRSDGVVGARSFKEVAEIGGWPVNSVTVKEKGRRHRGCDVDVNVNVDSPDGIMRFLGRYLAGKPENGALALPSAMEVQRAQKTWKVTAGVQVSELGGASFLVVAVGGGGPVDLEGRLEFRRGGDGGSARLTGGGVVEGGRKEMMCHGSARGVTKVSQVSDGRSSQAIFDNNEVCMIPDRPSIPLPLFFFSFMGESFSGELHKGCLGVDASEGESGLGIIGKASEVMRKSFEEGEFCGDGGIFSAGGERMDTVFRGCDSDGEGRASSGGLELVPFFGVGEGFGSGGVGLLERVNT